LNKNGSLAFTALLVLSFDASAQLCRLSLAGLNRNRRVTGPIASECPNPLHTAPFGNWGVTSNFGPRRNGHQFQGWCRDTRVCDNSGNCTTACRDGWLEWNSCTTHALYRPPNCTLYNAADCTEQVSTGDVNVLGTQTVDIPVGCPSQSPGSMTLDTGGCLEVRNYSRANNFMSIYELDPLTGDELLQTLYFPSLQVDLRCNAWGCPVSGGNWSQVSSWDSPVSPAKIFAEMAMIVNFGEFVDTGNRCRIPTLPLQAISAATLTPSALATESIAAVFTGDVTPFTESAASQPLPTTLAGVQARVTDSGGFSRNAALLYASPRQLNVVLPAGLREGEARLDIVAGNAVRSSGSVTIARVQPGVFTANANGRGVAAAVGIRVAPGGIQTTQPASECRPQPQGCVALPLEIGPSSEQFVLVLFGTGIRGAADPVRATVAGAPVAVLYAGPQPTFAGLDQVNLLLGPGLAGRGVVEVQLFVDGKAANPVTVWLR